MILEALFILVAVSLVVLIGKVASLMLKNNRAHQFFKQKMPSIPTLPSPNIFSGHIIQILWARNNYKFYDKYYKETGQKILGGFYCDNPVIATIDIDLIKRVVLDDPNANTNKFPLSTGLQELEVDNLMTARDEQWRRIRKAVAPAFSSAKIKKPNVQEEINSVIDNYMSAMEEKLNRASIKTGRATIVEDFEDSAFRYTTDLVFTCFYKQINMVDYHIKVDPWVERQDKGFNDFDNPITKINAMFPFMRPLISWIISNFHDQGRWARDMEKFILQQTSAHFRAIAEAQEVGGKSAANLDSFELKDGSKFKRNMMDYVIDQFRSGNLTPNEFKNTSIFLFLAGVKTSTDAISKLIWHLALNREIQDKLRESILKDGPESEYLHWCISESLRLFPPALIGCSRMLSHSVESNHGTIPKGVFILTSTYSIHHWKEYWGEDADEFKPERWADADKFHPCQYFPFGLGKRICPGKDFALQEMKMLMNRMLRKFKFEKTTETAEEISFKSPFFIISMSDGPLNIKVSFL